MSRPQVRGPARGPNRGPHRPRGPERIQEIEEPKIDEEKAMRIIGELGGGPGGCNSFDSCDKFCSAPSHDEECLAFAIEHELIQGPDIERIKKFQNLAGPGGCRGRACEAYCDAPGHEKECLEFAVENNLIPREEYEMVKRLIDIEGPGGCRGRACEAYCDAPGHEKECFEFAKQNGLIDPDEAAQIEKMMNVVGPGGCRGRECEQYCNDPQHGEECFAFAKEQGLISPDEIERVEEMKRIQRDIEIRSRRSIDSSRGGPGPRMEDIKRFEQDGREGMQQFNEQFNEFLPHEGSVVPMMRPEFDPSLGGPGPRMEDIKRFEQDGREGMQQFNEFLPHEGNVDPMMRPEFRQENEFFTPPSQPQQFDRAIGNPPSFQPGTQMIEPPHMEAPPPIDMHAAEPVSLLDFVIKSAATILGPFINITH
ncbi:MAG: hypothetical protein HYS59_01555 [Candidatus Vogelbacteria bacterium]|nr:hypothetical protein [Candidatus Vogelbacteria bacterium]